MVAGAIAGNISAEATTPTGNSFAEAMRGNKNFFYTLRPQTGERFLNLPYVRLQPAVKFRRCPASAVPGSQPFPRTGFRFA